MLPKQLPDAELPQKGNCIFWEEEYLRIPGVEADIIGMFEKR
jgi:hypothetical protein